MRFDDGKIMSLLERGRSEGVFSIAVAGFVLPDASERIVSIGTPENTVFDIASLTKVCPTSTLALASILEGKLSVGTRVKDFIPELNTNFLDDVRIFHLLTHSLDYRVPMKTLRNLPPEGILDSLFTYKFEKAPGSDFNYGNPPSVLLGIVLSRLLGKDLHSLGFEKFFSPLGMKRSGWDPLERKISRICIDEISPTEICAFRGKEIRGEIHDESAWVLRKLFPVGSAGMFSCVPDLLKFVRMVLNDGVYSPPQSMAHCVSPVRVTPPGILRMASENAFANPEYDEFVRTMDSDVRRNACTALGWELNSEKFMGTRVSPRSFGKTGFTGASIVADASSGAAAVLLSNFTYPHREPNADRINSFRREIADAFFGGI